MFKASSLGNHQLIVDNEDDAQFKIVEDHDIRSAVKRSLNRDYCLLAFCMFLFFLCGTESCHQRNRISELEQHVEKSEEGAKQLAATFKCINGDMRAAFDMSKTLEGRIDEQQKAWNCLNAFACSVDRYARESAESNDHRFYTLETDIEKQAILIDGVVKAAEDACKLIRAVDDRVDIISGELRLLWHVVTDIAKNRTDHHNSFQRKCCCSR